MSKEFTLKVYTPNGPVVETTVTELSLETSRGQITILPEHISYTSLLGAGLLSYKAYREEENFVICGGFVNFNNDEVLVLTDSVDFKADLETAEVMKEITEIENKLAVKNLHEADSDALTLQYNRLKAQQSLLIQ